MVDQEMSHWPNSARLQENLLAFRLEEQVYALPIKPLVKIVPMVTITPLPQVSDVVKGVINVQGETVPVLSLQRYLGMGEVAPQLHTPILLVRVREKMMAVIVSEVIGVFDLSTDQVSTPVEILPEGIGSSTLIRGLAYVDHRVVLLLDVDHLFEPEQADALFQVVSTLPAVVMETAGEVTVKPMTKKRRTAKKPVAESQTKTASKKGTAKKTSKKTKNGRATRKKASSSES